MDIVFIMSIACTAISMVNNFTPFLVVLEKSKTKAFHQIPSKFLMLNHLGQSIWLIYGVKTGIMGVIISSGFCALFSFMGLSAFMYYTKRIQKFLPIYIVLVITICTIFHYFINTRSCGTIAFFVALIASAFTFESIYKAVVNESYLYIDLKMAGTYFLTGAIWTYYGYLVRDVFVANSNLFGMSLGFTMLMTHYYFRVLRPKKKD
jgi:uncharacterized protein with PQ loop repeat